MVQLVTSFIEAQSPKTGVKTTVNIAAEIFFYRRMQKRAPIIVFDFVASYSILVNEQWELLCGGRHTQAMERAESIFKKLIDKGAKLAFFLEGPRKNPKFTECIRRCNDKYRSYGRIHKLLQDGLQYTKEFQISIIGSYYENFYKMAKKYGEIHISFDNECDADLAAYATENNALAVIADDTDFLIMPGDWNIWSAKNFNFEKFSTTAWNKRKLRELLNLNQDQMPIFSTLCGNVYITFPMVQHIHNAFRDINSKFFHSGLAQYIKRNFPLEMPLTEEDKIDKISNRLFVNNSTEISFQEIKDQVKISLEFYDYRKRKNNEIEPIWLKQHINETNSTFVYMVVKSMPISLFESFIDLSNNEITPYTEFILPILCRLVGVVLYEQREKVTEHTVLLKPSHEESVESHTFSIIFPDFTIPDISAILTNKGIYKEEKIRILIWIINKKLPYSKLTAICGSKCLMPCLALYFLVKGDHITIDEADICLLSSIENNSRIENRKPSIIYARPHYLIFLLKIMCYYMKCALIVSGLYKFVHETVFDSYFFHNLHTNYNLMSPGDKLESLRRHVECKCYK